MQAELTRPSVAADLRLTPLAKTVLKYLLDGKSISPMKALNVFSISRLAPCIYEIRKAGYVVDTAMRRDEVGHKYSSYSLRMTTH